MEKNIPYTIPTSDGFDITIMKSHALPDGKAILYLSANDYKQYEERELRKIDGKHHWCRQHQAPYYCSKCGIEDESEEIHNSPCLGKNRKI